MTRAIAVFILLLLLVGGWYFVVKPYDFTISFNTTAAPGSVYSQVLQRHPEVDRFTERNPFQSLREETKIAGRPVELKWIIKVQNDSTSSVQVQVQTLSGTFKERMNLIFNQTVLQKQTISEVTSLRDFIELNQKLFEVSILGEAVSPGATCACISLENTTDNKAQEMIGSIDFLFVYLKENKLELDGYPMIKVTEWDLATQKIKFDFCFPLNGKGSFPATDRISIKEIPPRKSVKAIFRGHYRFSNHAWLELLAYAGREELQVDLNPLEVFIDNPELGGDEREWQAEIYLPLKQK